MRQYFISIILLLSIFTSCKQEVSKEDFREMMSKQCINQMAPVYLGTKNITDEQLTSFCDCYIEYLIGENEIITTEVINEAMANQGKVIEVLSECAIDAKNLNKSTDSLNMQQQDSLIIDLQNNKDSLPKSDK